MTAPLDLAALKALYEAATPYPVAEDYVNHEDYDGAYTRIVADDGTYIADLMNHADASFYVAAHTHWLELLAMADEVEKWHTGYLVHDSFLEKLMSLEAEKAAMAEELASLRAEVVVLNEPILLAMTCPDCGLRHIDEGEWATRPHRTHRCVDGPFGKGCGNEWRPAHVHTVGVTNNELEY